MRSFLPPLSAALAACAPTPQEAAVRGLDPSGPAANLTSEGAVAQAVMAPMLEPMSTAENPYLGTSTDPVAASDGTGGDAAAQGRRIVSTAFVRLGPGGYLLVTMRDGDEVALRDVTMEKQVFCGIAVAEGASGKRQCHGYAGVGTARAVDAPLGEQAISAGPGEVAKERVPDHER